MSLQKSLHTHQQSLRVSKFAFPEREDAPTRLRERPARNNIAFTVANQLRCPALPICLRNPAPANTVVPVPKADVNTKETRPMNTDEFPTVAKDKARVRTVVIGTPTRQELLYRFNAVTTCRARDIKLPTVSTASSNGMFHASWSEHTGFSATPDWLHVWHSLFCVNFEICLANWTSVS